MRALQHFYQFCGLFIHCCGVPKSQKQWSTSFIPKTAMLSTFNNFSWIVSIDETCQGIMLNQWWILSTISCLTKLKYLNSDISKVINKGGILHGDKICLHPNFNPSDGKYPIKGVIGMLLLEFPIRRKEISLPQTSNIFRESCFHCVYRHCSVYQYQEHTKFENNIKKLSVKVLDISFCHHQHYHMPKSNNLCIWSHQKEDCWIQQGSPVLCTIGSHWELVGLVSESSMACDSPVLVIKTAPYLSWIRWLIKMNGKPLDSIFSSLCSFYPGVEYDLSNNKSRANFSSDGFSLQSWSRLLSSQSRQLRNPPPVFFVSNNKDSFASKRQFYFQGAHFSSGSKFPKAQPWRTPIFKTLGISKSAIFCNDQISNHFECITHSEAWSPKVVYISSSFPQRNALKYQNRINGGLLRYWEDLFDSKTVFHTISINAVPSLIPFSKQIDGFRGGTEIYSLHSQIKTSIFPSLHQFVLGTWLKITPDIRFWSQTHTISYETETLMWTPFHKEITQTQIYYVMEKITTGTYLETYSLNPWASLLVNKIEMLTNSQHLLNDYGSQYSSITPKLDPIFNQAWYLLRSQKTSTKTDGYMISPVTMTFLYPPTLTISYYWPLSKSIAFMSWSHYKPSIVIPSSQLDTTNLLNKHETTIVKPPRQTENTAWPLSHSNVIKPLIYSKINIIQPWTQTDSDILKLWTLSETESVKYLHTLEDDKRRLWLVTKPVKTNVVWFQVQTRRIESQSESPINHVLSNMKDEKILPMYQSQIDTFKIWNQTKLQIMPSWIKREDDKDRLWIQIQEASGKQSFHNRMETVLKQTQSLTQSTYKWILSETETGRLWKPPIVDRLRNWVHHEFYTVKPLSGLNDGIIKPRVHKKARTLTQWMQQAEFAKVHPHTPSETDIVIVWTQAKTPVVNDWFNLLDDTATTWIQSQFQEIKDWTQSKNDRVTRWTQTEVQPSSPRTFSEMDTSTAWTPGESSNLIPLIDPVIYTLSSRTQNEPTKESKPIADTLTYWDQTNITATSVGRKPLRNKPMSGPKAEERNNLALSESYSTSLWTKAHYPKPKSSVDFKGKVGTIWASDEYPTINLWKQTEVDIVTQLTCTESPLETSLSHQLSFTTIFNHANSPLFIHLMNPDCNIITTWFQKKPQSVNTFNPQSKESVTPWTQYEAWSETRSDIDIPWIQTAFSSGSPWTRAEVISEVNNTETINMQTQTIDDFKKTWNKDRFLAFTSFKEMTRYIFTPLIQIKSPTTNPWTHLVPDKITLWTQPIYPTGSQWAGSIAPTATMWLKSNAPLVNLRLQQISDRLILPWPKAISPPTGSLWAGSIAPTATMWLKSNSPLVNLWLQQISDRLILPWTKAISPPLKLQPQSVTYTVISQLLRAEYLPTSLGRKPVSDIIIVPWPQPELSNLKTKPLSDTKILPSSEPELITKYLWIMPVRDRLIPQQPQDVSSTINMRSPVISDTLLIPTPSWPLRKTLETNLRTLVSAEKKTTAGFQSEYSTANMLISSVSDKIILHFSHSKSLPVYLWGWPISGTVMQSWTQDEYSVKNHRSQLLSDTITLSWSLDNSPATKVSTQLISDEFIFPSIQVPSPKVNLFGLLISDTIILSWPQSIYSPVNRRRLSGSDKIAQLLPITKFSHTNIMTSSVSDIIMPHWALRESSEGNRWPWSFPHTVTPSWTQIESPNLSLQALIYPNRESSNASPSRNIFSNHSADIITQPWTYSRSPIFSVWILQVPVTISPSHQTEFTAGNLWPLPLYDTVTPMWIHSGSQPAYLWTPLLSDTITSTQPLPEPLQAKLWTLPTFNRAKLSWLQTEYKKINTKTLFMFDTYILPWALSKQQTLIPWTGKIANELSQRTKSEVLIVNSWIQSAYDTTQNHVQTPEIKHWTHLISDPVLLRNQATSPTTHFWEKYGTVTFTEWANSQFTNAKHQTQTISNIFRHTEISRDPLTKVETGISPMSQANSRILNLWTHPFENRLTSLSQSVSITFIPWTKFQSNTVRMRTHEESSGLTHWTQSISDRVTLWSPTLLGAENPTLDMRGIEKLWKFAEIILLKSWNQSATELVSQWITDKTSAIHVFPTTIFDKIFLFDQSVSLWTQTKTEAVIWREAKSFKNYVQTNSHHNIVTKWVPSEFSHEMVWATPEAGTDVVWQQDISKSFILRMEDIAKVVKVRIQTESSTINHFAKLVTNTLITQTKGIFLAINIDTQHVFDKVTFRTQNKYLLTSSWIQEENIAVNTKRISENNWVQPVTETIKLCIYTVYSTFNSLLHTKNLVTGWFQAEPQKIVNPWEKAKLSNIMHFTQNEFLSIYPCIIDKIYKFIPWTQVQNIPEYNLAEVTDSKAMSWSETDSFITNAWRKVTFSKNVYWNQINSLSLKQSTWTMASIVIPYTQKEFLPEDTWRGYSSTKGIHWIQEESSLEHSETMSLFSTVITWIQHEHVPVVPWTQLMDLTYTLINTWMLPSYNHIIWTHPEYSDVITPTSSISETLTPLKWDEPQVKNHWAQSVSDKLIPWTKFLSVSEKLWREGVFSTSLPWTKFISSSEITSIYSTYNAITPWAKANISAIITCILSDYHVCISWDHNEFPKSKLQGDTSSIVKQSIQSESPLDFLESKVTSRFTTWRFDKWSLVQTVVKVIPFTAVAWTKTEPLGNEMRSEVLTINKTSLNSNEFTPVQFYIHTGIDKDRFITMTEIDAKNILTVPSINIFRISMQAQTYVIHHSTQTGQTSVLWTPTETIDRNSWSFSELGSLLSWRMPVPLADDHWHRQEYHTSRNWFKTKAENVRPWTQPYFQTINVYTSLRASKVESWVQHKMGIKSWVNSATGIFNYWTKSETESIMLENVPKNNTIRPSFQMKASTNHIWFQMITNTIRVLPQAESQVISFLTQSVSDILLSQSEKGPETYLYMSDNNAVSSRLPIQNSLRQGNKLEPETVTPWIQQEWHIAQPWNRPETKILKTGYNFEADTSPTILTYSKSDEIKLWTELESPLVRRWPEDAIVTLWPLTKSDVIMPWSQMEYKTTQYLAQPNFDRIDPWIQHKVSTESLEIIPWTHSDIVLSHSLHTQIDYTPWPLTQTDAIRLWSQVEYEPTQSLAQTNGDIMNAWIQHKDCAETLDINSCTYSHRLISYSLQTQIHSFRLWNQLQSMTAQTWNPTVEQVVKTQALTAVVTVSPSFQVQGTLLRDEPILVFPYKSVPQDKHSLEPLSLRPSKLNVSLAECHLSMIWKDNLQALWIYKTAVVSHETTECGLRPGLVPYCPNCWEAEIGEFPWMVSVQLSYSHFCAGSILNEKWILTSARCANFIKRSESLASVQVGLLDLQDPTQGETVGIHRSMPYIGPRGPLGPGLIFLKEPLHFQPLVLPICLEESQEQERNIQLYDCWLPSWSLMRGSPGILQKRHLSIMQVSTCAKFWPQLNDFTFCVEAKKAMGESGCKGDLGAPLVCHLKQKDTWVQMGILIHFDEHCKKPYVFSEVSPFVFWLQRVTRPSHAPWSFQRPVTTSLFNSLSTSTHRRAPSFSSPTAVIHPHFISLPHPQALADHISLQYTMPWQAMIFSCGNQICSGSIISSYWVLTAAHCVRNMNPEDTVVILGLRHPGTPLRVVKVTAILLHERFRLVSQTARNDLALVLLQEVQSSIHIVAPLGNVKNINTSECWLSGPQILKQGDILENPEMLQIQVMGASNCAYLYPDIGSSTVCYIAQARGPEINMESVSPGSAVMCRPLTGSGKWTQIGFTSLKHLATIVSPHISWILSTSAKAGYPLNHALTPWVENPNSSSLVKYPDLLLLSIVMAIALNRVFIL